MTVTAVYIDQTFDIDNMNLAIIDVETDSPIAYSIEADLDLAPSTWMMAYSFLVFEDGIAQLIYDENYNVDIPLSELGELGEQFIEELLNAPVKRWIWG